MAGDRSIKAPTEEELKRSAAERELARQTHGFGSIVGQQATIQRLKEFAALYSQSGRPPGHVLFTGIDGLGKQRLARAFAAEYCGKWVEVDAKQVARSGDLLGVLTNLGDGDVMLIGDLARASKIVIDLLPLALRESAIDFDVVDNKGMFARKITVPLRRFTCLGSAPSKAECPPELVEIFPLTLSLQSYSQMELSTICERLLQRKGIAITPAAAALVAAASAGTPHHIEVLVSRLVGLGRTTISEEDVGQVSSLLGLNTGSVGSAQSGEIDTLSGVDFEKVIAALLQGMGFHTEMTEVTGDGGIDIIATLDRPLVGGRYLIQCKRFAPGKLVGAATVRDFYGALTADRHAVKGIMITTSGFTTQALAFARPLPIELIGGQQLRQLLAQYRTSTEPERLPGTLLK